MKKLMFFGLMMMMSTIIFAQGRRGDSRANETRRHDYLKKELGLNDDQVAKVKAIRTKYAERHRAIQKDTAMTQGAARKQRANLRAEQQTELKGVLTADQWTKFTAMKAKHEDRRKHRHGKPEKG